MDVNDALADEQKAIRGDIPYTPDIALLASIAKAVQTKIDSASEKRNESKPGKPKKRTYMQG